MHDENVYYKADKSMDLTLNSDIQAKQRWCRFSQVYIDDTRQQKQIE